MGRKIMLHIGISTACFPVEKGYKVTIFDPEPPGYDGVSRGNAARYSKNTGCGQCLGVLGPFKTPGNYKWMV